MGFDAMSGFQVGQQLGQGQSALGAMVKTVIDRVNSNQELRNKFQLVSAESDLALEKEKSLIPLKEASAGRLLEKKAELFPPQPKALSGETAGRLSLATSGAGHARMAKQLLFPKGTPESINRGLLVAIHSPWGMGMIGNQNAQSFRFNVERAVDAQLRSETGATAPPDELKRLSKQFIANAAADPKAAWERLTSLEGGLGQTTNYIDPTGYYRQQGSSPFEPTNNEDLSSVSDEDILRGAGLTE